MAAVAIAGVCLIAQPEFLFGAGAYSESEWLGIVYAVLAAVMIGSSMTAIRGLAKVEAWVGVFYYCLCGMFLNGLMFYVEGGAVLPCSGELWLFFSIGLLGTSSQYLATKSLQYERPSTLAVMRSIEIILVYFVQVRHTFLVLFYIKSGFKVPTFLEVSPVTHYNKTYYNKACASLR